MSKKTETTVLDLGSIERNSLPVRIAGRDFTLVELDGLERDKYQAFQGERTKFEKGEFKGVTNYAGLRTFLVALALRDENGNPVPQSVLDTWPARITEKLYDETRKLSGLDGDSLAAKKDEAKNA